MSSGNRTDISLEDPDFWQKWAKKAELDLDVINGRVSAEKHTHVHTHHFSIDIQCFIFLCVVKMENVLK